MAKTAPIDIDQRQDILVLYDSIFMKQLDNLD